MIFNYLYGGEKIIKVTINGAPGEEVTLTPTKSTLSKISATLDDYGKNTFTLIKDKYQITGSTSKKAVESVIYDFKDGGSYNLWGKGQMAYWFGRFGDLGDFKIKDYSGAEPSIQIRKLIDNNQKEIGNNIFIVQDISGDSRSNSCSFIFEKPFDQSNHTNLCINEGGIIRRTKYDLSSSEYLPKINSTFGQTLIGASGGNEFSEYIENWYYPNTSQFEKYNTTRAITFKQEFATFEGDSYIYIRQTIDNSSIGIGSGSAYGGTFINAIWLE